MILPILLTNPDDTIKLILSIVPRISVVRLPSRYAKTSPQIIPSGRPLRNNKIILYGAGITLKRTREPSAIPVRIMIDRALEARGISEITFIPMNLESAYPITCEIINSVL
jgi:hypothetical protein